MTLPAGWQSRLQLPLIAAPMTAVSRPELVSAACRNGIIGSFPSHNATTVHELSEWLTSISADRDRARGRHGVVAPLAVNVVVHRSNRRLQADLECILTHDVELLIASVGSPAPLVAPAHAAGRLVFADVATMRHVDRALACGVDGLVLLTAGAGGQTGSLNPFAFVRAVRARYDGPIVLAGGMADGASLWAAQTLGADLAYMGTKFIATTESGASDAYKRAVVNAGADDIALTTKHTGLPASLIVHPSDAAQPDDHVQTPFSFDHDRLLVRNDLAWSCGHSVVGVHDIVDTNTVIRRTVREYLDARACTHALLARSLEGVAT